MHATHHIQKMELDQPAFLPVGTEVSAKFKGAFCEARVKKLVELVKVKVQLKDSTTITVDKSSVRGGRLEVNQQVEVVQGKQTVKGQLVNIKDCSSYTVVFNDGDERVLKRTQLCPKSGKHFKDTETLDKLPLYHPDKRSKKKRETSPSFHRPSLDTSHSSPRNFRSASVTPLKGIASTRSATRAIAQLRFEETERSSSAAAVCSNSGTEFQTLLSKKSTSMSPPRMEISAGQSTLSWDRKLDDDTEKKNQLKGKTSKPTSNSSSDSSDSEDNSDDDDDDPEYNERRDLCVAHFYKFQEESGNQLNRVPLLGGKELDIYRFYDIVSRMGGHKRVTQEANWRKVLRKLHLEDTGVSPSAVKNSYIRYFGKFEAFMKNLGYSSLTVVAASSSHSRTTRIRGYNNPNEGKLSEPKKKVRQKEQKSSERESTTAHEGSSQYSEAKSRSGSIISGKAQSPIISTNIIKNKSEQQQPTSAKEKSPGKASGKVGRDEPIAPHKKTIESTSTTTKNKFTSEQPTNFELLRPTEQEGPRKDKMTTTNLSENLGTVNLKHSHDSTDSQTSSADGSKKGREFASSIQKLTQNRGRKPKFPREDRVKSPSGQRAVLEDIGYTNAHIFTRFFQGQLVHARHHLRFYDARVIMVKQPTLLEISNSLRDAFELSKITHQSSPELAQLSLENLTPELKDVLRNLIKSTKIFVHYLGWNSRYDEWLLLHKIRVDEKDVKSSTKAMEQLVSDCLLPELFAVSLDWCHSEDGISSLAAIPNAQSNDQRPRRLSSTLSKASIHSTRKSSEGIEFAEPAFDIPPPQNTNQQILQPIKSLSALSKFTIPHIKQIHQNSTDEPTNWDELPSSSQLTTSQIQKVAASIPTEAIIYSAPPLPPKIKTHFQISPNSVQQSLSSQSCLLVTASYKDEPVEHSQSVSNPIPLPNVAGPCSSSSLHPIPYSIVIKATSAEHGSSQQSLPISRCIGLVEKEEKELIACEETTSHHSSVITTETNAQFTHLNVNRLEANVNLSANAELKCEFRFNSPSSLAESQKTEEALKQQIEIPKALQKNEQKMVVSNQNTNSLTKKRRGERELSAIGAMSPPPKIGRQNKTERRIWDAESSEEDEGTEGFPHAEDDILSVPQNVLQSMEHEDAFESYAFDELSKIDDELDKCAAFPDEQVNLIEERMKELRNIYHKYKRKLSNMKNSAKSEVGRKGMKE